MHRSSLDAKRIQRVRSCRSTCTQGTVCQALQARRGPRAASRDSTDQPCLQTTWAEVYVYGLAAPSRFDKEHLLLYTLVLKRLSSAFEPELWTYLSSVGSPSISMPLWSPPKRQSSPAQYPSSPSGDVVHRHQQLIRCTLPTSLRVFQAP